VKTKSKKSVGTKTRRKQGLLQKAAKRSILIAGGNPQTPQYWVKKLFGRGFDSWSGIEIDEDLALTISALWNGVNIIAGAIGFLPLKLYQETSQGREEARNNDLYYLMHDRPNELMDAQTFRQTLMAHVLLWGNGYAEIEWNNAGKAIALWPILPNRCRPKVLDGRSIVYEVDLADGRQAYLAAENVLHIKGLGSDGLKGYSVITYAANSLGLAMAAEKHGAVFFKNDASPTGVIELPPEASLDEKARKNLEQSWNEGHQGLDKKHRIAIFEEGMKWHQIGISPEDAQLLQTRKFSVTDVARWLDLPPHMLKELDRATFSNIEQQALEFITWTMLKWFKCWEHECNYKLIGRSKPDLFFEFKPDALLRADTLKRYQAYNTGRQGGWLTVNEIRRFDNMNPVKGGDTLLVPLNMTTIGADGSLAAPIAPNGERAKIKELVREIFADLIEYANERRLSNANA